MEQSGKARSGGEDDGACAFAVTVAFQLVDGAEDEFRRLARENAWQSVRSEPGCRRFDVLTADRAGSPAVLLYEIYDSRAAFADHIATEHYRRFEQLTSALVRKKTIHQFRVAENAKAT